MGFTSLFVVFGCFGGKGRGEFVLFFLAPLDLIFFSSYEWVAWFVRNYCSTWLCTYAIAEEKKVRKGERGRIWWGGPSRIYKYILLLLLLSHFFPYNNLPPR